MSLDSITETIAHFIGLFNIASEEGRARDSYHEFRFRHDGPDELPILQPSSVVIRAPHELEDFTPVLRYLSPAPEIVPAFSYPLLSRSTLDVQVPVDRHGSRSEIRVSADPLPRVHSALHPALNREPSLTIEPPGSVAVLAHQRLHLSDDDRTSYGDHGLTFKQREDANTQLSALNHQASQLLPVGTPHVPGSPAQIKDFILALEEELAGFEPEEASFSATTLHKAPTLSGTFVNGVLAAEAPDYMEYRPSEAEQDEEDVQDEFAWSVFFEGAPGGSEIDHGHEAVATSTLGPGRFDPPSGIELKGGDNLLVNSVSLASSWLAASVTAVGGDYVELNAILQANVWSDNDLLTSVFGRAADEAETIALNIASIMRIDPRAEGLAPVAQGDFPSLWAVTQVTGDLLIMNWIDQFNFMTDNDISILSAMGGFATLINGDNTQMNGVSLAELGYYYDLIVVGGSIFDANVIYQMNVLLDDDVIGATSGFSAASGSLSSHGNLLWNEANITNVGAADRFSALPEVFRDAIDGLAGGAADGRAPSDLLQHPAFAGLEALRVLHITGDVINLQFIKQTNILGDSDQVVLAMSATQARADAQWSLATGSNTLVNAAAIHDVDALGATHVGGQVYSDELLIQADMIAPASALLGRSGDALVNEAVAFLSDGHPAGQVGSSLDGAGMGAPPEILPMTNAQADPMHILHA